MMAVLLAGGSDETMKWYMMYEKLYLIDDSWQP